MSRSSLCLATSLALILLSFLYAFGGLAWYGEQLSADPARIGAITLSYPIIAWAVMKAVRGTGSDALYRALFMVVALGAMHMALQGWWMLFRDGKSMTGYGSAIPTSGGLTIAASIALASFCFAWHAFGRRKQSDVVAVSLVVMVVLQGLAVLALDTHARELHRTREFARLDAEIQQNLDDANASLERTDANLREVNRILGRIGSIQQEMETQSQGQ
jgi:hypothetical protein